MDIDNAPFFRALAAEMNASPDRFRVLGDADMVAAIVMRDEVSSFAVRVTFEGLDCVDVEQIRPAVAEEADFYLDGPLASWQEMFDDICAHGAAQGRQTINSLALLGTTIRLRGDDPMGVDKFSRFNQTLQEYLDGAARLAVTTG